MSTLDLAIAWAAASVLTGPVLGTFLYRCCGGLGPSWDPNGPLDDAAIAPADALMAPRSHHTTTT